MHLSWFLFSAFSPPYSGGEIIFAPSDTPCVGGSSLFESGFKWVAGVGAAFACWGAHAPRVQCSAPSRNTRRLSPINDLPPVVRLFPTREGAGRNTRGRVCSPGMWKSRNFMCSATVLISAPSFSLSLRSLRAPARARLEPLPDKQRLSFRRPAETQTT